MNFLRFLISKSFFLSIVVAVVLIVGGIYAAALWLNSYTLHGVAKSVPDLSGFHYTEVEDFVADKELIAIISDSVNDFDKPRGVVVDQHPMPNDLVKPGRKIYLTINAVRVPEISMPELMDLTLRQAKARLQSYGLGIDSLIYKPSECSRCVIGVLFDGERINAGDKIEKGEGITLVVGAGMSDELIGTPYLFKLTKTEVEDKLFNVGLTMGFVRYDETVINAEDSAAAFTVGQFPSPDELPQINLGRAIDVILSIDSTKLDSLELPILDTIIVD